MQSLPEFSCLEQYKILIKDVNYNNLEHYNNNILPLLLENHPLILKDIKEKNVSALPKSFCKAVLALKTLLACSNT